MTGSHVLIGTPNAMHLSRTTSPFRTLLRPLCHCAFRSQLRLRLWLALRTSLAIDGSSLPSAVLRYRASESLSAEMFLRVDNGCARHLDEQVELWARASRMLSEDSGEAER
jgi:hypothetical protein